MGTTRATSANIPGPGVLNCVSMFIWNGSWLFRLMSPETWPNRTGLSKGVCFSLSRFLLRLSARFAGISISNSTLDWNVIPFPMSVIVLPVLTTE